MATAFGKDWHADSLRTLEQITTLPEMLQQAAELAAELPGAELVGVSLVAGRERVDTAAATDELAARADRLHAELCEGPLYDAIGRQVVVYLADLADELRWPTWVGRMVSELGLRSMLSYQLFTEGDVLGALSIYSAKPHAFELDVVDTGYLFAAHVGVAVSQLKERNSLRSAIASRTLIGQAEGILMERYGLEGDAAFNALRRVSQNRNTKLREIAAELVHTRRLEGLSSPTVEGPEASDGTPAQRL
jgi:GAF domain-containing protein